MAWSLWDELDQQQEHLLPIMQYTSSIFLLLEQEWDVGLCKKKKKRQKQNVIWKHFSTLVFNPCLFHAELLWCKIFLCFRTRQFSKDIFFLSIVHCLPLNEEELLRESLSSYLKDRLLLHLAAEKWKDKQTRARISSSVFALVMCPHEW